MAQSTPSTPNGAQLERISCTSATSCLAVGEAPFGYNNASKPLAVRLSGSTWTISSPVWPAGSVSARFSSVSCSPSGSCMAVGWSTTSLSNPYYAATPLAERFTGGRWKLEPVPAPSGDPNFTLDSVSCPAWSACVALGGTSVSERWNGSSWALTAAPPSPPEGAVLGGLACSSATNCTVVATGWSYEVPLADGWNGSAWRSESVPAPITGLDYLTLSGVSCPRTTLCVAVGSNAADNPAVAVWRGARWQPALAPQPLAAHTDAALTSVSCASATFCMAVGWMNPSRTPGGAFSETWNGKTWRVHAVPSAPYGGISSVSCWAADGCAAVGEQAEMWNGSAWSIVPSPESDTLKSVSCTSASFCLAVGDRPDGTMAVQRWDGSAWSNAPVPTISGQYAPPYLTSVSCRSASFCEALGVGAYSGGAAEFAVGWTGDGWTATQGGLYGTEGGGISCPATSECLVADTGTGPLTPPGASDALWNGATWTPQFAPTQDQVSSFSAISCSGTLACTAVGWEAPTSNAPSSTFIACYAPPPS